MPHITDAFAQNDRAADTSALAERSRRLRHNASSGTVTMGPARRKDLEQMQAMAHPWSWSTQPTRSASQASPLMAELHPSALSYEADARLQQMRTVSAEP